MGLTILRINAWTVAHDLNWKHSTMTLNHSNHHVYWVGSWLLRGEKMKQSVAGVNEVWEF